MIESYHIFDDIEQPVCVCHQVTNQIIYYNQAFLAISHQKLERKRLLSIKQGTYRIQIYQSVSTCQESVLDTFFTLVQASCQTDLSIDWILEFIGQTFQCQRVYVFEKESENSFSNTYEWCNENVVSQQYQLQSEPIETFLWWYEAFDKSSSLILNDVEEIKESYPLAYATLKSQNISSLMAIPLKENDEIYAFLGVDDFYSDKKDELVQFLKIASFYISLNLKHHKMIKELKYSCYHDNLTGAFNRNALQKLCEQTMSYQTIGVVYCDVTSLKKVNDFYGHDQGDQLILSWYGILKDIFSKDLIYRLGGDEFLVVCLNLTQEQFLSLIQTLEKRVNQDATHLAYGSVWSQDFNCSIIKLMEQADQIMYDNKREYYCQAGKKYDRNLSYYPKQSSFYDVGTKFDRYYKQNYFNLDSVLKSLSFENCPVYLYFGDLQNDVFYINDNMKERFDFENNLVPHLLQEWGKRIYLQEDIEKYYQDIDKILTGQKDVHDLRYRIKDANEKIIWVHCQGLIQRNQQGQPIFFSGCVTVQDYEFMIDRLTNFPQQNAAMSKIIDLHSSYEDVNVIGFSLNYFHFINETFGRKYADRLLMNIANRLNYNFGKEVYFYCLNGLKYMAIIDPSSSLAVEDVVSQLHSIVHQEYHEFGAPVHYPCSTGVLNIKCDDDIGKLLENIMNVISMAKENPQELLAIYSHEKIIESQKHAKMMMELHRCVKNHCEGFRLVMQLIVSTETEQICGGELLLRWTYENQDISPQEFIPMLEKSNLIIPVGKWIVEKAMKIAKRVIAVCPDFKISMNISYLQILDETLIEHIENLLDIYQINGNIFNIELTETHFDDTPEKLQKFMKAAKLNGIRISLDDFGKGYSSLNLLLKYPLDVVKLDRSLLQEVVYSSDKEKFIKSVVYACHQFGKQVCIEGVETYEEMNIAKRTCCDYIQGYYYYKPSEIKDVLEKLSCQ